MSIYIDSIKFGTNNLKSVLPWGLLVILAAILSGILMSVCFFIYPKYMPLLAILFIISLMPILIVYIAFLGFIWECINSILIGSDHIPSGLDDIKLLLKNGSGMFLISLEYIIGFIVSALLAYKIINILIYVRSLSWTYLAILIIIGFLLAMTFAFMCIIQWIVYVESFDLLKALIPADSIKLIINNPVDAFITFISLIMIYILFNVLLIICEITMIFALLLPFIKAISIIALVYIVTSFYLNGIAKDYNFNISQEYYRDENV